MANPTLTPQEYEAIVNANKKVPEKAKEVVKYITKDIPQKMSNLFESLAYLIIVSLYFTFTGLAILFKRKLPEFWTDLAKELEAGRIITKVREVKKTVELKKKAGKMRVVDLDTKKPISL